MSLCLVATSASLSLGVGEDEFERPVLRFDVNLREGEIVCLSSDGVFRNEMKGQVSFYPADGDKQDEAVGIGKLRYYDDDDFFLLASRCQKLLSMSCFQRPGLVESHLR